MTKNTSTPTKPPGSAAGQKWQTTTTATATARRAWISGRISLRAVTAPYRMSLRPVDSSAG